MNFDSIEEKVFYFEDILSMFLEKLFEIFFNKIFLKNGNNKKDIKLCLQLSLPNYLTYLQKKIIEKSSKIFLTIKNHIMDLMLI